MLFTRADEHSRRRQSSLSVLQRRGATLRASLKNHRTMQPDRSLTIMCAVAAVLQAAATHLAARASFIETKAPTIEDYFACDWQIEANISVVYSRNFNRHQEFAYAACETSHCNVSLITANSAGFRSKTCEVLISQVSSYGSSGISSLHLPDAPRTSSASAQARRVALVWWRKIGHYVGAFVNSINMTNCKTSIAFPVGSMSKSSSPPPPHVVVYKHPIYSTIVAETGYRAVMTHTFSGGWIRNIYHIGVGHAWTGEEQPVEIGPSRGFFVIGCNGPPDWTVSVIYANVSSGWNWLMADILHLNDSSHTYPKTSGAYQKYGLCWKSLDRDDRVNCSQFLHDGRRAVREVSLRLPEPVDWLAVHNLNQPAMLLVTGQCHGRTCYQFKVMKIDATGQLSLPFDVKTLDVECPKAPRDLSMDVVEDFDRKLVCFHFVCLNRFDEDYSDDRADTVLQYRRNCIKKVDIESMLD